MHNMNELWAYRAGSTVFDVIYELLVLHCEILYTKLQSEYLKIFILESVSHCLEKFLSSLSI